MSKLHLSLRLMAATPFLLGQVAGAADCNGQARYVKSEAKDGKGFKQAITIAVAPGCTGPCHGLVSYTVTWKDKAGAEQKTEGKNVKYTFAPGQGSAPAGAAAGGGTRVTDETVVDAGACADGTPCKVTGATVTEVSCFKEGGGKCTATATYVGSESKDGKGFKQGVTFDVSSADGGAAYKGLVKYTLNWTDKGGAAKTSSKNVPYKSGGGGGNEVEVVDETVLGAGACADGTPCAVVSVSIDKVSCFLDK